MHSETAIWTFGGRVGPRAVAAAEARDVLLVHAQQGDPQAFDRLMRRHQRQVFGTAWRLVGRVEDAQDIAQEVFLRLYRHLGRLDPARPVAAWLYRVTVNACRDLARRRRPTVSLETVDAEALPDSDPAADPAAASALADEQRLIAAALATLGTKERSAIVLRDLEGLSTRQVAEILEATETTVRSHISRARLKIRRFRAQRQAHGKDSS